MEFQKKVVRHEMVKTYVTSEEKTLLYDFFKRKGVSVSDGTRQILLLAIAEMEKDRQKGKLIE